MLFLYFCGFKEGPRFTRRIALQLECSSCHKTQGKVYSQKPNIKYMLKTRNAVFVFKELLLLPYLLYSDSVIILNLPYKRLPITALGGSDYLAT